MLRGLTVDTDPYRSPYGSESLLPTFLLEHCNGSTIESLKATFGDIRRHPKSRLLHTNRHLTIPALNMIEPDAAQHSLQLSRSDHTTPCRECMHA